MTDFIVQENSAGFGIYCQSREQSMLVRQYSALSEAIARQTCEVMNSLLSESDA